LRALGRTPRLVGWGVACSLLCLCALIPGTSPAAAPAGPRLAFVEWSQEHRDFAVIGADASGKQRRTIAGGRFSRQVYEEAPFGERPATGIRAFPVPVSRIAWSPDGGRLAFSGWRIRRRGRHRWAGGGTFVVGADGRGLHLLKAARGLDPVFAPDGATLAFAVDRSRLPPPRTPLSKEGRYERVAVWTVRLDGTHLRQVTPWRSGIVSYPSSFSPDGSTLAVTQFDRRDDANAPTAVAVDLESGAQTPIAADAEEPVYSPDGAEVAFLGVRPIVETPGFPRFTSDVMVAAADGSGARLLTDTPRRAKQSPSWDPSGERIAYLEDRSEFVGGGPDAVMEVNADGTCRSTAIPSLPQTLLASLSWQPGPGRGAGRIAC